MRTTAWCVCLTTKKIRPSIHLGNMCRRALRPPGEHARCAKLRAGLAAAALMYRGRSVLFWQRVSWPRQRSAATQSSLCRRFGQRRVHLSAPCQSAAHLQPGGTLTTASRVIWHIHQEESVWRGEAEAAERREPEQDQRDLLALVFSQRLELEEAARHCSEHTEIHLELGVRLKGVWRCSQREAGGMEHVWRFKLLLLLKKINLAAAPSFR